MEKSIDNYSRFLKDATVRALGNYFDGDIWDGSKFWGSLGSISEQTFVDYWTLRKRSMKLFRTNIYAKGVIRRLIWNEISTGIVATPTPIGSVIWGAGEDTMEKAVEWGEKVSTEFYLYADTPSVFDWGKKLTFGAFQELVRFESLVSGDGIIINRVDEHTGLLRWQWVNGDNIMTPDSVSLREGHFIRHGVEFNQWGKKVAFYVRTEVNGEYFYERVPVRGEKSGRLISWMVYGSERLVDDVRGEPFLADSIYILKDLDRARDAEVRAALVNAMIPLFYEEAPNQLSAVGPADYARSFRPPAAPSESSGGISGAPIPAASGVYPLDYSVTPPTNQIDIMNPGMVYKAPNGGKITSFQTNRPNVNYSQFERSVIAVLAWSHGVPPEMLMMEYGNN